MPEKIFPTPAVIGVLRGDSPETAHAQAVAAIQAGLDSIEVTFTLPDALNVMAALKQEYSKSCRIGAGTVLTPDQVASAIDAGADYLVSPNLDLAVVNAARDAGKPHIPGVLTPTEVQQAVSVGCSVVKVFPISRLGGPAYLRDLGGPFPDLNIMATGGITLEEINDYFAAGAQLVGLGAVFGMNPSETSVRVSRLLEGLRQ